MAAAVVVVVVLLVALVVLLVAASTLRESWLPVLLDKPDRLTTHNFAPPNLDDRN
jgi:hypothetical protein